MSVRSLSILLLCALPLSMGFEWEGRTRRLERQYASGDARERQEAVRAMGAYAAREVRAPLLRALEDPEGTVRREAALAAGRVRLGDAVPMLVDWLEDPDEEIRAVAARALGEIGDVRPLPLLVRSLGDPSATVRLAAIDALGALRTPETVVPLLGRLDDEDTNVRVRAAHALGRSADPRAVVPLIGQARDSAEVRQAVYEALGLLGDTRGAPALIQGIQDEDENARLIAVSALGRVGTDRAVRPLAELARGSDNRSAEAAASALANIEGDEATRILVGLLRRPNLQPTAARVLATRPGDDVTRLVAEAAASGLESSMGAYASVLRARLARQQDPTISRLIVDAMSSPRARAHLLEPLAQSGDPTVLVTLLSSLDSATSEALAALRIYFEVHPADERAADPLLAILAEVPRAQRPEVIALLGKVGAARSARSIITLTEDASEEVRSAAVTALGQIGGDDAREALFDQMESESARIRFLAAQGLTGLVRIEDAGRVMDKLEAPPPIDRHAYLDVLSGVVREGELDEEGSARLLAIVDQFLRGGDEALAARVLGTLADWPAAAARQRLMEVTGPLAVAATMALGLRPDGEEAIRARLTHPSARVRMAAAARAGEYGASMASALMERLNDAAWPEPSSVAFSLARLARRGQLDADNAPALCAALSRRDPNLRANLVLALAALETACPDAPIQDWVGRTHAPVVRGAARRYLSALGEPPPPCDAETDPVIRALCSDASVSEETERVELYVFDRSGTNLMGRGVVSLWLADGTVFVGPTDARAYVRLEQAPMGRYVVGSPLTTPLEP